MSSSGDSPIKDKSLKKQAADTDSSSDEEPMSKKNKGGKKGKEAVKVKVKAGKKDPKKEKKRKRDQQSDSDDSDAKPRKIGTARRTKISVQENDDGDSYIAIDDNRRVTVKMYKKRLQVDLREVRFDLFFASFLTDSSADSLSSPPVFRRRQYYPQDGKMKPGSKGLALTGQQWDRLKRAGPLVRFSLFHRLPP
jgi:hypothetical protein